MYIALIAKPGHVDSGVGRYVVQLTKALEELGHQVTVVHPVVPVPGWLLRVIKKWLGWDLYEFLNTYPVWARYPEADIYHLGSQNLATLMTFCPPPGRTVVTVHDIIPWLTRGDPEMKIFKHRIEEHLYKLTINNFSKIDTILTDSEYTKNSIFDVAELPRDRCKCVMLGIH